jgi:flagellar motility protein MotE (MotC chaperone)
MSRQKTAPKKARKVRAKSGALLCLSLLLAGSGALRLSDGAGMAIAREIATGGAAEAVAKAYAPEEEAALILAALDERERKLDARAAELEKRAAELAEAEASIEQNMARLVEAEEKLAGTMALAETAAEDDIGRLTSVYESMKPKDAARLFSQMEPKFAAGFLGRMRPDAAAEVMAGLEPEVAYSISVVMAGRNAGAPTH